MDMNGKLYIDGKDAYSEYGVFVEQGGYAQLVQMPSFKTTESTDWPELDGEEVDLTDPKLDTRTLQVQFCITDIRYAEDLFDELSSGAYHTFLFTELDKTYKLRMTQNGSFSACIKLGKLALTFADDLPEVPEEEKLGAGNVLAKQTGYEVDGKDFSRFGSFVLTGTDESIRKAAQVKTGLTVTKKSEHGVLYDDSDVRFKSKEVTLKLLIDAPDIASFWARYNALFAVLMKAESRTFYYRELGNEYECYYKGSSVTKFEILSTGKVWCEFSVTLVFTNYRPVGQYKLLSTDGEDLVVVNVDGEESYVSLRPKRGISLLVMDDGSYIVVGEQEQRIYFND